MPNNEGSAGAGRDGSRLRQMRQLVTERGLIVHLPDGAMFSHDGFNPQCPFCVKAVLEIEALAVPDPLASDTGQGRIKAPWTIHQQIALNRWQQRGDVHPFTCGTDDCGNALLAFSDGWHCLSCDYRQDWAHGFMASLAPLASSSAPQGEKVVRFRNAQTGECFTSVADGERKWIPAGSYELEVSSSVPVRASGEPQKPTADVERWRDFYRALLWMVNDYIGVCGISADFTEMDARLGYAHEGYHNAGRILADNRPPMPERLRQFNDGTACLYGGNKHPDRCVCQEKERGQFAGTPHKHYDEPPYSCARCSCKAYEPALPSASPSDDGARQPQGEQVKQ